MKVLLMSLLLVGSVSAIGIEYDEATGGVTVIDIGDNDQFGFYYPTKYNVSVGWKGGDDLDRTGLRRFSIGSRQPGSYSMVYVKYERPLGFPNDLFVGTLLQTYIEDDFENDFLDQLGDGTMDNRSRRPWSSVWEVVNGKVIYSQMVRVNSLVPEPRTWMLGVVGFLALVVGNRIRKM